MDHGHVLYSPIQKPLGALITLAFRS
uniref:Uncharacterized protein n=1 Tax=Arundo donax TaxID=35708 RepID=A0A0A9C531_ARUDO